MRYKIYIFFVFLLAPFIGLGIAFGQVQPFSFQDLESRALDEGSLQADVDNIYRDLHSIHDSIQESLRRAEATRNLIAFISEDSQAQKQAYEKQYAELQELMLASAEQHSVSGDMLENVLSRLLGDPIGQTFGNNATVKVYSLQEAGYRGYMAKVRLHNVNALRMVISGDRVGAPGETTSAAARRSGAVLAINAGGFFAHEGGLLPIGITVIDGEILTFSTYDPDLSFVGFNRSGQLIGGRVDTEEQLAAMNVLHGSSFLPTLLKGGQKQPIPSAWANTRHPRTLIGHFENDELLLIVIDGRRQGWSSGVTLEEAQDKLLEFKVRDAYNLDGGGSSAFYYNGKILNRPSDGSERRVATNIVILP